MTWWRERSETFRDGVGAVAIVATFLIAQQVYGNGGSTPRAVAIVLVMGISLTVRRRWPAATYTAALATVVLAQTGTEFLAVAAYTLLAHRDRPHPNTVAGVSAAALTAGYLQYWPILTLEAVAGDLIYIAGIAILPPVFGRAVRRARNTTAELELRNAELVALREQAARHAVETERFRIARELHDVVAHHVSAMTVRARAGRHVAERDPQAAADALAYVAEAGTEALTAMGSFVGTLRGEAGASSSGDLSPQPDLDDLADLMESFRRAGLVVHADIQDPPGSLPPALELNVYRMVQEALTNAMRHGAAERAWVRLRFDADRLCLTIDDNGSGIGLPRSPAGHGLVGIAERAALHGGTSSFGPGPRGGCRLQVAVALGPALEDDLPAYGVPGVRP